MNLIKILAAYTWWHSLPLIIYTEQKWQMTRNILKIQENTKFTIKYWWLTHYSLIIVELLKYLISCGSCLSCPVRSLWFLMQWSAFKLIQWSRPSIKVLISNKLRKRDQAHFRKFDLLLKIKRNFIAKGFKMFQTVLKCFLPFFWHFALSRNDV